jgi:hypothetical protein
MDKITHIDKYNVSDVVQDSRLMNSLFRPNYGVKGLVYRILKDGIVVDGGLQNMVVANGRRFVAQHIVGTKATTDPTDLTGYVVSHFGIGSGGVTWVGSTPSLNGPAVCDLDLTTPIPFSDANVSYLTSPAEGEADAYVCKAITTGGSIEIVENTDLASCLTPYYFTWIKFTCLKDAGEPTHAVAGASVQISESALYYVSGTTTHMFAHICFYPKWVEKESQFTIEWYVLC